MTVTRCPKCEKVVDVTVNGPRCPNCREPTLTNADW